MQELQLINKHGNEKYGNYCTHKFLSKTLRFVQNNKNSSVVKLHAVLAVKYHEKYNVSNDFLT